MSADDLLRGLAAAHSKKSGGQTHLVDRSEADLYAALAQIASDPDAGSTPESVLSKALDPDNTFRSTGDQLGKRIYTRWSAALHEFLCNPSAEDKKLRRDLLNAIFKKDKGSLALLAGGLVAAFGISTTLAMFVAALVLKVVVAPALDETCKVWGESLAGSSPASTPPSPPSKAGAGIKTAARKGPKNKQKSVR